MGVIKEWNCIEHGEFESTHPICPEFGCESRAVVREFRTAPTIGSRMVKQFEAGMKRTSDMMHISNFRSAREGEAAYGGDAKKKYGAEVLWGNDCQKVFNRSFAQMTNIAQQPTTYRNRDGSKEITLTHNNGMRDAATEAGITKRRVAKPGELAVHKGDDRSSPVAKSITA